MTDTKLSQWQVLRSDRWLLASLTWIPLLLVLSIWWIFSEGIARDLPIGVVDLQQSSLSRKLVRTFDATSALQVEVAFKDLAQAKQALAGKEVYAYIVIPNHFDRDIYLAQPPQVSVFYNSQFILVGKLINSAAQQAHGTFNAQVGVVKQLAKGNNTVLSAAGKTLPIRTQITPMFNKNSNYAQFLVSAIVPAIWQIAIVISTVLLLASNLRLYGLKKIASNPFKNLMALGGFYLPFFVLQGMAFLLWFYTVLEWPMAGSFVTLIFAQLVTVIACMMMGGLFFFLTLDATRAMSFAGAFTAPSFAFMGVTFPVTDMNAFAEAWRAILPISHYIEAQIEQVSYGLSAWETISRFAPSMLFYLLPFLLTLRLIKKHLSKLDLDDVSI